MSVVLVHGLGVSHRYFARLREVLPASLAPDLAGDSIAALTDSLARAAPERATYIANSLGCQLAVELAVREPARVERLVLVGATWDPIAASIPGQLARILADAVFEPPSLLPSIVGDYVRWGPRRLFATARSALRDPFAEKLPRVEALTFIVRGEHDPVCTRPWAERMTSLISRARLVEIAGAGHAAHWSHPRRVADLVDEAL